MQMPARSSVFLPENVRLGKEGERERWKIARGTDRQKERNRERKIDGGGSV